MNTTKLRDFPLGSTGGGHIVHYLHGPSGAQRSLCGHGVQQIRSPRRLGPGDRLCLRCAASPRGTAAELAAYFQCTDCEVDCRALGEDFYQVRSSVWAVAYPGYNEHGVGVGTSRPCIGCLEERIGRRLTPGDFTTELDLEEAAVYGIHIGPRLIDRWQDPPGLRASAVTTPTASS